MMLSSKLGSIAMVFETSLVGQWCYDRVGRKFTDRVFWQSSTTR